MTVPVTPGDREKAGKLLDLLENSKTQAYLTSDLIPIVAQALLNERVRVMEEAEKLAKALTGAKNVLREDGPDEFLDMAWQNIHKTLDGWQAFKKKELMGGE